MGSEVEHTLTTKTSGGIVRTEVEALIPLEMFDALWDRCVGTFEKYRYDDPRGITIDVFTTSRLNGLVVAEMEFESLATAQAFQFPIDLAETAVDVTEDKGLKGKNLALNGLPDEFRQYLNL